ARDRRRRARFFLSPARRETSRRRAHPRRLQPGLRPAELRAASALRLGLSRALRQLHAEKVMNDDDRLPVDALGRPLAPRMQPGYYPGYSTLALRDFWDDATRRTVLKRVLELPPLRFF